MTDVFWFDMWCCDLWFIKAQNHTSFRNFLVGGIQSLYDFESAGFCVLALKASEQKCWLTHSQNHTSRRMTKLARRLGQNYDDILANWRFFY